MRFLEFLHVLTEAQFRKPIEMYHGTSSKFLRSILKQGIVPNPKEKKWSDDPHASLYNLSRESLEGSYWTTNIVTALSSSTSTRGKFGGDAITIIAMISEGSAYADEDSVTYTLTGALPETYTSLFGTGIVSEYVPKLLASMYWGGPHTDAHVRTSAADRGFEIPEDSSVKDHILKTFSEILHKKLSANPEKQPINYDLMRSLLEGLMLRGMAFEKKDNEYGSSYLTDFKAKQEKGLAPEIPELEEIERDMLALRDQLTKSYKKTAYQSSDTFNHTLRTVHPVTYSGANKIIGILGEGKYLDKIPPNWKYMEAPNQPGMFAYFDDKGQRTGAYPPEGKKTADEQALKTAKDEARVLTIHYGIITDTYKKKYRERIGRFPGAVDTNGRMVVPPDDGVNESYADIITEARIDFLRDKFSEQLQAFALKKGEALTNQDVFGMLAAADPTKNKQFLQWLIKIYLQGNLRLEDTYKATEYLTVFIKAKPKLQPAERDINRYQSLIELYQAVTRFREQPEEMESGKEQQRAVAKEMHSEEHAEILWNDNILKVVIPKTEEASCYFGRNTEWCTAATTSTNRFSSYSDRGPLYIILDKTKNKRWQLHFDTGQFMDETEEEVNIEQLTDTYPQLLNVPKLGDDLKILLMQQTAYDTYRKNGGMTPDLLKAITSYFGEYLGADYNPGRKIFVLDSNPNAKSFIDEYVSDSYAIEWAMKALGGDEYQDFYESVSDEDVVDLFDDLQQKHPEEYERLRSFFEHVYGDQYEDDFSRPRDLVELLEDEDEELLNIARSSVEDGHRYGAEAEMSKAVTKYFEDLPTTNLRVDLSPALYGDWWEGAVELILPEDDMAQVVQELSKEEADLSVESWESILSIKDIDQPNYGWQDYDEKAALETFMERIPEGHSTNYKIEAEE